MFFLCSVSVWRISRSFYFAGLKEFHEECLSAHNEYRIRHGAAPLHWSAELAWEAQQWAENLAQTGELRHNEDDTVGENLAGMVGGELSGREAVDMWYEEIESYDFESPGYSEDTSNFTQVGIIRDVFMTYSWVWFIFDTQQLLRVSGSVGAVRKLSPNWSHETMSCHCLNCFSVVWGQGNAPLVPHVRPDRPSADELCNVASALHMRTVMQSQPWLYAVWHTPG